MKQRFEDKIKRFIILLAAIALLIPGMAVVANMLSPAGQVFTGLGFIMDGEQMDVRWDEATNTVYINTSKDFVAPPNQPQAPVDPPRGPTPIIVIPGIMGSSLAYGNRVAWLHGNDLRVGVSHIPYLRLDASGNSVNPILPRPNVYGVNDEILAFIASNRVRPYYEMMRALRREFGITTVRFFAYDWRLCNRYTARYHLAPLIDELMEVFNAPYVHIVAHSMGGLVAAQYIADGHGANIRTLTTIGTPFLGAPKVPYVFATGKMIGTLGIYVSRNEMRRISSHMHSAYQLIPFRYPGHVIGTRAIVRRNPAPTESFIRNDLPMLNFNRETVPPAVRDNFLSRARTFRNDMFTSDGRHVIQTVDYHVIVGTGRFGTRTINRVYFNRPAFRNAYHVDRLRFTPGDGTVPEWSATINGSIPRSHTSFVRGEHTAIMYSSDVINIVIDRIRGNTPIGFVQQSETGSNTVISIGSPVNASIRRGNEVLSTIPGEENFLSSFGTLFLIGPYVDSELFAIDGSGNDEVLIVGTGYGTMDYTISFYRNLEDEIPFEERIFVNVPITPDTVINTTTGSDVPTVLHVDVDGDGRNVIVLEPDYIINNGNVDGNLPESNLPPLQPQPVPNPPLLPPQVPNPPPQPTQDFSISIGQATSGLLEHIREVTVEAHSARNIDGMFLVVQITVPGRGLLPTVSAIQLQNHRREVVTISYVHANSVIEIVLVEDDVDFLAPGVTIHAFANAR